jgi:hypothetical protein
LPERHPAFGPDAASLNFKVGNQAVWNLVLLRAGFLRSPGGNVRALSTASNASSEMGERCWQVDARSQV